MKSYTTEEIATAAGVTLRTVRFWHTEGLLGKVERNRLGIRQFNQAQMNQAKVVRLLQMSGKSLDEIKATLAAPMWGNAAVEALIKIRDFCDEVEDIIAADKGFDL